VTLRITHAVFRAPGRELAPGAVLASNNGS
jgi:hypothetical protein